MEQRWLPQVASGGFPTQIGVLQDNMDNDAMIINNQAEMELMRNRGAFDPQVTDFSGLKSIKGMTWGGKEAAALQVYLNSLGANLAVDGKIGNQTLAALQRYIPDAMPQQTRSQNQWSTQQKTPYVRQQKDTRLSNQNRSYYGAHVTKEINGGLTVRNTDGSVVRYPPGYQAVQYNGQITIMPQQRQQQFNNFGAGSSGGRGAGGGY